MKSAKRGAAAPTGLPGSQQQAREWRAGLVRRAADSAFAVAAWAVLVLIVGPTQAPVELPALGRAPREVVALRDFAHQEPVVDLPEKQQQAVAGVPVHYAFDQQAAQKRIENLQAAFRLARPRYRLYLSSRERLVATLEAPKPTPNASPAPEEVRPRGAAHADRIAVPPAETAREVAQLDQEFDEELQKLRPEFERLLAARRSELNADVFGALRKAGFDEQIELLLTDVAHMLLGQWIVRDMDRFEDDLARGVYETGSRVRYDRASARGKVLDLEGALRQADEYVGEFVKRKSPSALDEPLLQAALRAIARSMVDTTFARDKEATRLAEERARDAVEKTHLVSFARGQLLVERGESVTEAVQGRVKVMLQGMEGSGLPRSYLATAILLGIVLLLFFGFAKLHLRNFRYRPRDVQLLITILVVHGLALRMILGAGKLLIEPGGTMTPAMWVVLLPYALGPTLATLFMRPITAAPFGLMAAVVAGVMGHNSPMLRAQPGLDTLVTVQAVIVGLAGVHAARQFRQRSDLVVGAATVSGVSVLGAIAIALFTAPLGADVFSVETGLVVLMGVGSGLISYLFVSALAPILESLFNRLTDIKLLELASMNHPALRLLATEAPGTFTHSVMVGNLAQAGCDAIGGNGLLSRVGAYYHDLGKTRAPRFFAENQAGENPHDRLKPHLSALIIKTHVKDGIKILREFRLPDEIVDFVPQHHGTGLIQHFYNRARIEAGEAADEVVETDFRYPGPKPQRRETALLMLADSVEAAARALPEPNPQRVREIVKKIIATKLSDSQFDECDLTLRELAQVEEAFVRVLAGMHHTRPAYLPPVESPSQPRLPGLREEEELGNVAIMADGGVGVRPYRNMARDTQVRLPMQSATAAAEPVAAPASAADRPAGPGEAPHSPTALVSGHRQSGSRRTP